MRVADASIMPELVSSNADDPTVVVWQEEYSGHDQAVERPAPESVHDKDAWNRCILNVRIRFAIDEKAFKKMGQKNLQESL